MFLDTANKSVVAALDAATTTECDCVGSYADITETVFKPGSIDLTTDGTTKVTVIPAPAAGVQRQVKEVTICNPDVVSHTAYLWLNNNGVYRLVMQKDLLPGDTMAYRPDALAGPKGADGATGAAAGTTGTPADFGVFFQGKPDDSQEIFLIGLTRAVELPSLLSGSVFDCRVAPTADYVATLYQNGVSIGTITFPAGLTTGTASFAGGVVLNPNDVFEVTGQGTRDATLEDISLAFAATFV